ncbi:hypothetical protein HRD49_42835, partial [Corallococcus exiguus]|nr:hypothetical protein [Corallococcus exiguus]
VQVALPPAAPVPDVLPFELGQDGSAPAESFQDGVDRVFREVKRVAYTWVPSRDESASRQLLAWAGAGGVPEVLRRWRNGLTATFGQRVDHLGMLVRRWDANAQPETRAGAGPPGRRPSTAPAPASQPEEFPQPF